MFCGKACGAVSSGLLKPRSGPVAVTLHVYSAGESAVVRGINAVLKQLGTGAYHCGVEVYDLEWSFADTSMFEDDPEASASDVTGIFYSQPKQAEGHSYCESLDLGYTYRAENEVFHLINRLEQTWHGETYDVLEKNCCHFCVDLARELGVREPPRWVMSLADRTAVIITGIEDMMERRQRFASRIADSTGCACVSNTCCDGGDGALVEKIDVNMEAAYADTHAETEFSEARAETHHALILALHPKVQASKAPSVRLVSL